MNPDAHTRLANPGPPQAEDSAQNWMRGSSELKGPLLALLLERPGHPYALAARLRKRLGSAWEFAEKDIYKILVRFENQGLVVSHVTDSKRSSAQRVRMYELTELTRGAVAEWIDSPLPEEPVRAAIWARVAFSEPGDAPRLLQALDRYQKVCYRKLKEAGDRFPVDTWVGMQMEVARRGANLRTEADLEWIDLARGYIANFPGARDASAGV